MRTEAEAPRAPEPPSAAGTKRAAKLGSLPGPWQGQPHAGQPPPPRPRLLLPLPPASSLPLSPGPDRPLRECHVAALITNPHRGRSSWRGGTPGHVTTSVKDAPVPPAALAPRVSAHLGLRPSGERWPCRRSRNPSLTSFSHLRSNFLTFPP